MERVMCKTPLIKLGRAHVQLQLGWFGFGVESAPQSIIDLGGRGTALNAGPVAVGVVTAPAAR